jgi:hypothetical protein
MAKLMQAVAVVAAVVASLAGSSAVHGAVRDTVVAAGRWGGVNWQMKATSDPDGSYCIFMYVPATARSMTASSCGSLQLATKQAISYLAHPGRPRPAYVVGPVIGTARLIEITLSNGKVMKAPTITPPAGLTRIIRFYANQIPCPSKPTHLLARDQRARIVAQRSIPRMLPKDISC